jgi:hypothetical protein
LSQAARNSASRIAVDKAAVKGVALRWLDFMVELQSGRTLLAFIRR